MNKKQAVALVSGIAAALLLYRLRHFDWTRWLDVRSAVYRSGVERLQVPMPDGVLLATDHYYPVGPDTGPFPSLLIRTPYGRRLLPAFYGRRFAERGYHVVVQDVRGRFASQGEFKPFLNEVADGRATLAWLESQPWFDGRLGLWGQSYLGYVQWALATSEPDKVKAMVPGIASSRGTLTGTGSGAPTFDLSVRWLVILDALGKMSRWPRMFPAVQNRIVEQAFNHLPIGEADVVAVGQEIPFFRQGLQGELLAEWLDTDLSQQLGQVTAPVYLVGGWYDFMLHDLLVDYRTLQEAGREPYLTIGPWAHLDSEIGRVTFREGLDWFDAHLKKERANLRSEPVCLYVMGANEWRTLPAWPPPAEQAYYYLQPDGRLSSHPAPGDASPSHYLYDPADPTPAWGGPIFSVAAGPLDNRPLEARPDVLTFTTLPLEQPVDVVGPVRAELYVSSSRPSTDFFARLCDVMPDGRSINLCEGLFRLAPGQGEKQADGTVRLVIDMWATANQFRQGHQIRVQISSGAHPRYARNLGTGESPATAVDMQTAQQTIFHDQDHPSALLLPIV